MAKSNQNHPGYGTEYEIYLPAYLALKLNNHEEISDFSFRSNSQDFGNFDDVVLDIKFTNGTNKHFAFQLKHKGDDGKTLSPAALESTNNPFSLPQYCQSFKNLKPNIKNNYQFIIYTNANLSENVKNGLKIFKMDKVEDHVELELFNTSDSSDKVYNFSVTNVPLKTAEITKSEYKEFFSKLTFYTGQKNFKTLEQEISRILGNENVFQSYVALFRKWHQGRFSNKTIDRTTVNFHLCDMFLWTYNTDHCFFSTQNPNMELFDQAVHEFDVTLLNKPDLATCQNFDRLSSKRAKSNFNKYTKKYARKFGVKECMLRLAKDYKFTERTSGELDEVTQKKIYFYFFENLLVVDFYKNSEESIYQLLKLYKVREDRVKFVLLGRRHKVDSSQLLGVTVFQNLDDIRVKNKVLYENIITKCKISLQGRSEISLKQLSDDFDNVTPVFKTEEVVKMLKERLLIGEEKISNYHILRKVSTIVFSTENLLKLCRNGKYAVYIVKLDNNFKFRQEIEAIDVHKYLQNGKGFDQMSPILSVSENFNETLFEDVCNINPGKPVHFFKSVGDDKYLLVRSTSALIHEVENTQQEIFDEEEVHTVFDNPVNILIAEPGMGKSKTLNYLGINCPHDFWAINENLKDHYMFFNRKHSPKSVLKYFIKTTTPNNIFIKVFIQHRKMIFFLDGLDEIPSPYVKNVLDGIEKLSRLGFRVWVSSRPNLQNQLLKKFNIFSIGILELSEEEQERYVQDRLQSEYNEDKIKVVMKHIFTSVNMINNLQILGIPLQLYIITEILLSNPKFRKTDNFFVLTKLYKYFFEGKYRHCVEKTKCDHPCPFMYDCSEYLEQYETLALQSLFDDDILHTMNVDLRKYQYFINKIKTEGDPLGIVKKIDGQKGVFEHNTYAEYFAATFFSKNFDKARVLINRLFVKGYSNVLLMLNIKLCEHNPLHLAIIHKNFDEVEKHLDDEKIHDEGGRNPLHLAMDFSDCVNLFSEDGDIIDSFEAIKFTINHLSTDDEEEIRRNNNLIRKLMLKFDPYERDRIFDKDSFHYAILQGNLFAIEFILENFGMTHEVYKDLEAHNFINNPTIAYYSVLWGYLNLLTISLDKRHSKIVKIIEDSFKSKTLLRFALQSELKKKNQIAELLVDYGLSDNVYKNAILHLSVQNNDLEFTKMLLDEDTNFVDARDKTTGNTVLHIAVKQQNREMVKLLLEKGSNVKAVNNLNEQAKHLAIQNQDLEILQMLLSRQQQHTDLDYHDEIMLHYAVATTNIEIINYVLDQNLDVNFQDEDGKTAVHIAAEMGHYQSVVVLLQKGANFSLKTKCGLTVLHCAVLGNNIDIIKMCLSDQQINMTDDKGEPPLFYAIRKGSFHVVELLLDKGAAVDITSTIDKDTVLHVASACTDSNKIIQLLLTKKIKIVSLLLDNGADITKISTEGINIWSFLSNSQMRKHETTINLILERGANPNLEIISVDSLDKTTNHGTPLSKAIASNCWDLVEKLLQYEAKIQDLFAVKESFRNKAYLEVLLRKGLRLDALNKEDLSRILMSIILHEPRPERNMQLYTDNKLNINIKHDGDTSLHQAVALGKSHVVTWLLQNQADVNATNFKLKTPLQVAVATKQLDIVHLLLKNGADINYYTGQNDAIWESLCKHFPKDCAKIIVNTYPNLKVLNGLTPLYYAVDNDDEHMVRRLMEKGADVNDSRAFRKAVQRGNISIVDLFLERGYQADSDNPANQEVMSIAGSLGNCSLIDLLLRRGFKINSANSSGDTALYLAAKNNHFLVTKLLILRGADVNCASQRGETLWDYLEKHDTSITEAILQKGVTEMRLSKSNQNSLLHYAIRHCDERLVNFLLQSPEVVLDCNDPSLKVEAILRKNSPILQALERRRFGTNVQVKERVDSCLRERRSFDILCWLKEDDMTSETDTSSLYKLLHLAVYLGNDEYVDFVFKRKIDMDSVDVYNSLYPLHFARENGVLKRRLLVEMTRWIDRQYIENKLWKLEDMRRHVLQRYPLNKADFNKKHKHSYLTNEVECIVSKKANPLQESRFSVLNDDSVGKHFERSSSTLVNWLYNVKDVVVGKANST